MSAGKCSLLVVDDEVYIVNTLAALASKEFEVVTAGSGAEAIQILHDREIDIVLTDQRMAGMSGVQLLEWVRENSPQSMRLMMSGLGRLEDAVAAINCGQVHRYLFKPWQPDELLQMLRNAAKSFLLERSHEQLLDELRQLNQSLEERVQQRTRELEEANHQLQQKNSMLEKLALTDPLTGIPNRRAMDRLVRTEQRRRARYPNPLAIGVIDVDHFKEINERHLLSGGDYALVSLGHILTDSVRAVDSVGRIGGEEFMVVAPETSCEGAMILAERIRTAVERAEIRYKEQSIKLTVSVGFAVVETGVIATYDQMKHMAALSLGEAKHAGRNCSIVRPVTDLGEHRDGATKPAQAEPSDPSPDIQLNS